MNPCVCCIHDPDICQWHPCNDCDADDKECAKYTVMSNGFDCNCFEKKETKND